MRSFICHCQAPRDQHRGNMTLILFASVNTAGRINFCLHQGGRLFDLRRANLLTSKGRASFCRQNGAVGRIAKAYSRTDAASAVIKL